MPSVRVRPWTSHPECGRPSTAASWRSAHSGTTHLSWPHLQVVTTCDSINPETYHAEVRMDAHILIRTEPTDDLNKAERAAENAFTARIAALLQG